MASAAELPSAADLDKVIEVASAAARKAGDRMLAAIGTASAAVEKTKANKQDLVTAVDKACQEDIEACVRESFGASDEGGHHVLGEESVGAGSEASASAVASLEGSEWLWVVDPIDGTTNFVHGVPLSVVSIGVAHRGRLVAGVILDPYRSELFAAVAGRGTTLNGAPVRVSSETALSDAYLTFGTHTTARVSEPMLRAAADIVRRARAVRSLGSAALHLAWTACGRCSGFWELDLNAWDLAAGALLVREAGGRVSDTRGGEYGLRTRDVLASNGAAGIHDVLVARLAELGCDRPDDGER